MKVPARPPALTRLISDARGKDAQRLIEVLALRLPTDADQEYLHWDKLRFMTPPLDLTREEWWLKLSLSRRQSARHLDSLLDVDGNAFWYCLHDSVLRLVDQITRRASGEVAISELVTNKATRNRYLVDSLIEEAITSSQLEGATTTRRVARDMIRSGRPPSDRSELMIFNNYRAMQRITELRTVDFSPALVCEIHRIVTEGTLDRPAAAGVLQDDDAHRVAVWSNADGELLHAPPRVAELPARLERLCEFANGGADGSYLPPLLRSLAIHFMVGYDHYFEDGNGRTARVLFYWSMLRDGYWLAEFLTISKILKEGSAQYGRSFLLTETDQGDLTYFFIYHLGVIRRAIDELHAHLVSKVEELRQTQRRIMSLPGEFNHRQLAILNHALRNPRIHYTAQSHARSHNVTTETARRDLGDLERKGFVTQQRVGKQFVWIPVADLAGRLDTDDHPHPG